MGRQDLFELIQDEYGRAFVNVFCFRLLRATYRVTARAPSAETRSRHNASQAIRGRTSARMASSFEFTHTQPAEAEVPSSTELEILAPHGPDVYRGNPDIHCGETMTPARIVSSACLSSAGYLSKTATIVARNERPDQPSPGGVSVESVPRRNR